MDKKKLLAMSKLLATPQMKKLAIKDAAETKTPPSHYRGAYRWNENSIGLFLRCRVEDGILMVSLFYPEYLRAGAKEPSYVVYVDRASRQFLTYGTERQKWFTGTVESLSWPAYIRSNSKFILPKKEQGIIKSYLGTEEDGYWGLQSYQQELCMEKANTRYAHAVAPWDADMALTPPLPKDWLRWVDKVGIPAQYIFYQYRKGGAKTGYCTYCEKEVPLKQQPYHKKEGRCPCCHRKVQFRAYGRSSTFRTNGRSVYLLQRRPDGFILREFWVYRTYHQNNWGEAEIQCSEVQRTICDSQFQARDYYWYTYKNRDLRWAAETPPFNYGNAYYRYCYGGDGPVYGKTLPSLKNNELRDSNLVQWIYDHNMICNPRGYLHLLSLVPPFERIQKANLPALELDCKNRPETVRGCLKAPFATNLTKALGLDTQRLRRLRKMRGDCVALDWLQYEKAQNTQYPDKVIEWFSLNNIKRSSLDFVMGKMSPIQIYNYVRRQSTESGDSASHVVMIWRDYLSMAASFGMDTDDAIIYRASKLRLRHDQLVLRAKMEDAAKRANDLSAKHPTINKICKSLSKYEHTGDAYAVIAPKCIEEIYADGYALNHCLFRSEVYWDRMEAHETYILFLRRRSAPDVPYYTLEIEPDGTVRQARTEFSRTDDEIEQIKAYLKEWQTAISARLTKADHKRAKKSKVLRAQEFERMRKDNVQIRVGDLAGRRLVDVLMADLMEAA